MNISMDKVAFPGAIRGGSLLREENGMRQIVSSLRAKGPTNPISAYGYLENETTKGAANG